MATDLGTFDPLHQSAHWEVGQSFFPVSPEIGWMCMITGDDGWKASQNKPQNKYIALTLRGLEGAVKDVEASLNLNLVNDSPKAQEIARAQLTALFVVTGTAKPVDRNASIADIMNKPFRIVSVMQKDERGERTNLATNGIRYQDGREPASNTPPQQPPQSAPAQPMPPPPPPAPPQQTYAAPPQQGGYPPPPPAAGGYPAQPPQGGFPAQPPQQAYAPPTGAAPGSWPPPPPAG